MPVGALGGSEAVLSYLAPIGPVYQAGTLSGNPLAMAAGLATLSEIEKPGFFQRLTETTQSLVQGLSSLAKELDLPLWTASLGGMFGFCFTEQETIRDLKDISASNEPLFKRFYHAMLNEGIYFAPSMYEAGFVSIAHGDLEIKKTIDAAFKVLCQLKKEG